MVKINELIKNKVRMLSLKYNVPEEKIYNYLKLSFGSIGDKLNRLEKSLETKARLTSLKNRLMIKDDSFLKNFDLFE